MAEDRNLNFYSEFFDKYTTVSYYLSRGSSGCVYGPIPWQGSQVALKQAMFVYDKVTDEFRKEIEEKKDIWTSLDHKNLMKIHWVDLTRLPKVMFIVMEFAFGGSLHKTLRSLGSENKLPIDVVTDWAKQIAEGMQYLHNRNIVHRDLKSSNILLMEVFDVCNSRGIITLKITDFDEVKEHDHTTTMSSMVGTCAYMAPEVLVHAKFSKASDVWSYGVVVWEMLSGDTPHKGLEPRAIIQKSSHGKLDNLSLQQSFPEDYKQLLNRCWSPKCGKRLLFNDICDILQSMVQGKDVTQMLTEAEDADSLVNNFCISEMATVSPNKMWKQFITESTFIGRGGFGDVYGPYVSDGKNCAIKKRLYGQMEYCRKEQEACQKWMSLHHKNLITVFDISFEPPALYILMEYGSSGSLKSVLKECTFDLPPDILTDWSIQVAEGMAFLHQNKIIHTDLKSPKIFIMEPDAAFDPCGKTLKITGFDMICETDHASAVSIVGTLAWMAPEVFDSARFSEASDVWSYGVILWEMSTKEIPYKDVAGTAIILGVMNKTLKLTVPYLCPDSIRTVLEKCLLYERDERPTFNCILSILKYSQNQIGNMSKVVEGAPSMGSKADASDLDHRHLDKPASFRLLEKVNRFLSGSGYSHACCFSDEMTKDVDSEISTVRAGESINFESAVLDKYATTAYYLNKGAYANVYGPIPWQNSPLVIKQVLFAEGKVTNEFKKRIEQKKCIWNSLEHKNLMKIHQVDLNRLPKVMFIVMDFAAGGSLHKTLRSLGSENKLPIDIVTDWAKQIAEGMLYLHKKDIVHRDLKSSNILLMEPFDVHCPCTIMNLKIADFNEVKEHGHTATMSTLVETRAYMAPEVLREQRFSKASDVWSYGVVIWEMLSGDIPHRGLDHSRIMYKSIIGELDDLPLEPSFPGDYKLLLSKCWESTHTARISFDDISIVLQRSAKKLDPDLIGTIETKTLIKGWTIMDNELFILNEQSAEVEIYDMMKFSFSRRLNLKELIDPIYIGSCSRNKCLYIFDLKINEQSKEILRVGPYGNLIKKWSTGCESGYGLTVTDELNIIFTLKSKCQLNEYSPDGNLIREINFPSAAGIHHPLHALRLTNGHFLISHGSIVDDVHRVCIVDADGKLKKSFGGQLGSNAGQMIGPVHFSVDGNGFVLVVYQGNGRVLLLDTNLESRREILSNSQHAFRRPLKILLASSRLLLAESECCNPGLIKIYQF